VATQLKATLAGFFQYKSSMLFVLYEAYKQNPARVWQTKHLTMSNYEKLK